MNAASQTNQTKIFGMKVGIDPKIILLGLLVLGLVLFFVTNRGGEETNTSSTAQNAATATPSAITSGRRARLRRNRRVSTNRDTLRIEPVDAAHGDIDPTLRLEMLARLQKIPAATPGRSLFELAPQGAPTNAQIAQLNQHMMPKPITPVPPVQPAVAPVAEVQIPFKYYGFAKGVSRQSKRRGLFLEGDNVLVASEGDVLDHKFLIVSLTAAKAQVEDTSQKRGKMLDVVPEAIEQ